MKKMKPIFDEWQKTRYPFRDGRFCIEIQLKKIKQLFSTHDPSPFRERDLDDDAVEYIVGSLKEIKLNAPTRLSVYLPPDQIQAKTQVDIAQAIHNYFSYEDELMRKKTKALLRQGQMFLLTGLLFLSLCLYTSLTILSYSQTILAHIFGEGLNIIGWVAMWSPIEIFLYDWRPLKRMRNYYQKLKNIEIEILSYDHNK